MDVVAVKWKPSSHFIFLLISFDILAINVYENVIFFDSEFSDEPSET